MVSLPEAIRRGFTKYVTVEGRATRAEYWWWYLFVVIVDVVAGFMDGLASTNFSGGYGVFQLLALLALLVPTIAVGVRRLHDTDKSGWFLLLGLIPCVGPITLIVFFVLPSNVGPNRFGVPSGP
jgi:uncharacterized membrane protein YhaH (DUF805 family)